MIRARAPWVIYVTLFMGLIFVLIPLPIEWRVVRPDATALILLLGDRLASQGRYFYGVLCRYFAGRD